MIFKYIAGKNIETVLKTARKIRELKKIPVFNYAVESSTNANSVFKEFEELSQYVQNGDKIAIKLSSFNYNKSLINDIIEIYKSNNNKVIIDAESNEFQKQYQSMTNELILNHNKFDDVVIKTYQMYRKDSLYTLKKDIEMFKNVYHPTKLVRGAYWNSEFKDGHLFTKKEDTDTNYNMSLDYVNKFCKNKSIHILATHNSKSIDIAREKANTNFEYGHLLGMKEEKYKDLVLHNEKVNVYLPYGPYTLMLPYLFRRLYENIDTIKYM